MRLSGPRRYVSVEKGMKFCLFHALHLQERYIVAFEEKEDLIKVSGAVQPVVEQIQVHLGRQKLNSKLPEGETGGEESGKRYFL